MKVTPFSRSLAYVLVADADQRRTDICLQAAKVLGVGALVARTHDEAMGALRNFGAPLLLVADLLLPPHDGMTVIETARRIGVDPARTRIMAWAAAREVREFAICRLAGLNVRILSGAVAAPVITETIGRLLKAATQSEPDAYRDQAASEADQTMEELATRAREISGTAGVAVYLKAAPDQPFRSASTWLADEPVPASLEQLPITLQRIIESREPFAVADTADDTQQDPHHRVADGIRGFIAVPITDPTDEVAGMICVFDNKPLTVGHAEVEALKALGHHGSAARVRPKPSPIRPSLRVRGGRDRTTAAFPMPTSYQPMTLLDRHEGAVVVTREMARARREQNHLSVVVFDVDAADAGEAPEGTVEDAIESAGHALTRVIRGYDLAIRWSRQELVLVLPGVGGAEAGRVADRVRAVIESGDDSGLAVAGGVAELEDDSSFESIVARANERLRQTREQNSLRL